ncbi:MAG: diguanylate cyclase [Rhodobacteraceae bacterium CG17_big_fil_post_rev_8_21_14_2_50_63_15]|nr:ABC transporter substrate-binding protein [Roseovarius sp.]PIV79102.1 MAG: diguanylate cyclase [Rhodobacteraceae bacterium CG17_big_fil_post_rev_8_21_14_2_50_63_15]
MPLHPVPLPHPALNQDLTDLRSGNIGRREFLSRATALGLSAAAAYALGGLTPPAWAQTAIAPGGTLRIQQSVKPLKDPRSYDWSELANQTRGFLEYLVEYQTDGTFRGFLLESWEVNADATRYVLRLRPGILWNTGEAFDARDVAHNITRWCDTTAPGNSMAGRFAGLIDPETGQARDGAVTVTDALTVTLTLSGPDIAVIANLSDYPAAIVHQSYDGGDPFAHGIGTGPFRPVSLTIGQICVLERDPARTWWGSTVFGGPYLDRIEFIDHGTNPSAWLAAAEAGEVDLLYETVGHFIDEMNGIGWRQSRAETAATMVVRASQSARMVGTNPYINRNARRAMALAVDNAICLELGYGGRGTVAANHHVSPIHPAYADIGPAPYDPAQARREIESAGLLGFVHDLVTIDDEWQRNTGDAIAAQLRDAGLRVRRRILPGATFWSNWREFPFSATQWNHRPLDVQVLGLAYRSGAAWNESGFANAEFDALLDEANRLVDTEARRVVMARLQTILRDEGVIIQPFWRALYNHHNGHLVNAEKHPSNEIHLYKIGFSA